MSYVTNCELFPGMENTMVEPDVNRLATDFIATNYEKLLIASRKMGVREEKCHDIVHDVLESVMRCENNGAGYNPNKGNIGEYISLEEFVYGRLKKYSLNKKYRVNEKSIKEYDKALKGNKNVVIELPSSCWDEHIENLTFYQKAYATAPSYDDLEKVELELSVGEELEYCLTFENQLNMNLRYFLKNISKIATMDIEVSVFQELRKLANNSDFIEAIRTLIEYAKGSPEKYEALVSNI